MEKYLTGYKPPPPKKQKTELRKTEKEKRKEYEENRDRTYKESWKKEYPWVKYDDTKEEMQCTVCIKYGKSGNFVTGCNNLRKEALYKHDRSKTHNDNVSREEAKPHKSLSDSTAGRSLLRLNKAVFDKLCNLFRNAHMVAKLGRPYTDYISLCQLDKAKSVDIGMTYQTDKSCQQFVTAIADDCRDKQDLIFSSAPFLSIISDGSTDTSSQEAEILFARTSLRGKISTNFIGLKNVGKADAEGIVKALKSLLDRRFGEDWRKKMIAMGTDGASVMLGSKSGVVQRFRGETGRQIYAVHCSAHRLELAYKDATKSVSMVKKIELLLLNLYMFYKYSSLNRANLMTSFKTLEMAPLVPTRVGGTRWLPHTQKALQHTIKGHPAIVQHLEQMQAPETVKKDSSAKARNFLRMLKDKRSVMWLHLLADVVTCLSDVSLAIQIKHSTVSDVWLELQSAKRILQSYLTRDGPNLRKLGEESRVPFGSEREKFLTSLIDGIDRRFEGDMELFKGSSILSFKQWPKTDEGYGDDHVQDLTDLAQPALTEHGADPDRVLSEWTKLKTRVYESDSCVKKLTWEEVFDKYDSDCPNFLVLVDFLLSIPSSSVDAERGFSRMKMVKNDWRSRLGERNLTDLMLLYMESPSIQDFNPEDAIQKWYTSGQRSRRPNYMDEVMNCAEPVVVAEEGCEEEREEHEDIGDDVRAGVAPLVLASDADDKDGTDNSLEMSLSLRDVQALQRKQYEMFCELLNQ